MNSEFESLSCSTRLHHITLYYPTIILPLSDVLWALQYNISFLKAQEQCSCNTEQIAGIPLKEIGIPNVFPHL